MPAHMSERRWLIRVILPFCLLTFVAAHAQTPAHLVMISVDGLMPSAYVGADASLVPTLKALTEEGATPRA